MHKKRRGKFEIDKMAGSKWDEVLKILIESYRPHLPNIDRWDIVSFCVEEGHIRNIVCKYLESFQRTSRKNESHSLAKYDQGKQLHNENKSECLSLYNSAIAYATRDDPNLPEMFNSRSLVLDQLGYTTESLQDIEMAVECGLVEDSEVIVRKAECMVKLGNINKAIDVLNCLKLKEEIKKVLELKDSEEEERLPKLTGGENKNFACASRFISVFQNTEKGRHVIANQDLHPGDVLFIERPFAFVLFKDVCHNCCRSTVAPIFCWECMDVVYCSSQCRDNCQKTFHQFECGFGDLFKSIGIAHLSLRVVLKASSSLDELKAILTHFKEPKYGSKMISCKVISYGVVYNLVNNLDKYDILDLFQYSVTALLIALHLRHNTWYMGEASTEEDLKFLSSILLRHILQLICNGHAIVDTFLNVYQKNSVYTEIEERIGTAIYPSASMMNHSCQPSIINSFYNNVLVVRAAKEIQRGEEVYNCYGPDARRMRRSQRQEILKKQYFFICECDACLEQYDIQEIFTAFRCTECEGAFVPEMENSQTWICVACGKMSPISSEFIEKEILFYSLIKEGEYITDENITLRLQAFLKIWRLGREIFYKYHKDLAFAGDEVARCLAILGDFRRCVLFLRCCVLSVEKRFGAFSIELAKEMKKLADAIMRHALESQGVLPKETIQEGVLYYDRAENIISLLYSPHHQEIQDIKENRAILKDQSIRRLYKRDSGTPDNSTTSASAAFPTTGKEAQI